MTSSASSLNKLRAQVCAPRHEPGLDDHTSYIVHQMWTHASIATAASRAGTVYVDGFVPITSNSVSAKEPVHMPLPPADSSSAAFEGSIDQYGAPVAEKPVRERIPLPLVEAMGTAGVRLGSFASSPACVCICFPHFGGRCSTFRALRRSLTWCASATCCWASAACV